mmetsp:Transcript_18683/g.28239  ORF Transcript_18683/g.28239 Transcript_18683/m.28239 type:complete len:396 (-) Transcript_18683:131-1318(-)
MCCCCPPAINALFCLWFQSGCSKGSVAGALTFFPPDPPLYSFERYSAEGEILPSEEEESKQEEKDDSSRSKSKKKKSKKDYDERNTMGDDEELVEIVGPTGYVEPLEEHSSKKKSPAQELTDRAKELRRRAKIRFIRDTKDAENGVKYRLVLDPRLARPSSLVNVEAVKIPSKDAFIASIIYRVPADRVGPQTKTLIYSHGNATDIGAMFQLQAILAHSLECNVVCYDYSGYGESGGVAQEKNTYTDIRAVYDYCVEKVSPDPSNIILYGQSVGSGPVCHFAYKNNEVGGIILHSPFTSGMRVLTPSRLLACLDIFPNINRIKHVRCPVMIIHGKMDEEVNCSHGEDLYNATPEELRRDPWWVPDRGHNDITEGQGKMAEYIRRLRAYLNSLEEE